MKKSKLQAPTSRETSSAKFQTAEAALGLELGLWNFPGTWMLDVGAFFACAACFGANIDSPMADGMNWAILTLGTILSVVLGGFLTFLIYAIRKSEALTAAAERNNIPEASKI